MAAKFLLPILLSFLLCGSLVNSQIPRRLSREAQQCRLRQLTAWPPSQKIESEGGFTELWDETNDEFQCGGFTALKFTIKPNSLGVPRFYAAPTMMYIERGEGHFGKNYPGCAETFEAKSGREFSRRMDIGNERTYGERPGEDQHQKVYRIRRGDMVVLPAGTVHWFHNDGSQDLVIVVFLDLNNNDNQLDFQFRSFFLAGGLQSGGRRRGEEGKGSEDIENIFKGLDQELVSEAYKIPYDLVRKLGEGKGRGSIVKCNEDMEMISPEQEEEELSASRSSRGGRYSNGLEEAFCTTRVKYNMNTQRESDIFSRESGRINILNHHKLPILRVLGMSAEKGHLFPEAQYNIHWSMTDHRVVYVVEGDAEVRISDDYGNTVFNCRVTRGNIFVIPQFYTTAARAGSEGFEWITFKTFNEPMKSPVVGYTSVFRGLPLQLLEHVFQISTREAQQLKQTRRQHSFLLPPTSKSSRRS